MLKFKISRLPKYFHPYAELHFKRAAQNDLPNSVRNCPRHMFHFFHRLGAQQWYVNCYKTVLTALLQNMEFHLDTLKTEHSHYESASDNINEFLYDDSDDYIKQEKNHKNERSKKTQKYYATSPYIINDYPDDPIQVCQSDTMFLPRRGAEVIDIIDIGPQPEPDIPELVNQGEGSRLIDRADDQSENSEDLPPLVPQHDDDSSAGFDSVGAFCDSDDEGGDVILESAFGAHVTFLDDNNNVITMGDDYSKPPETNLASDALSCIEVSNIDIKQSNSEACDDENLVEPLRLPNIHDMTQMDDMKPAALPLHPRDTSVETQPTLLPLKIPNNNTNATNDEVMQWLEHQNPLLANSFAQEFKVYTT